MYQIHFYYQSDKTIEPHFLKILVKTLKSIVKQQFMQTIEEKGVQKFIYSNNL